MSDYDLNQVPVVFKYGKFTWKTTLPWDSITPEIRLHKPFEEIVFHLPEEDRPLPEHFSKTMLFRCRDKNPEETIYSFVREE